MASTCAQRSRWSRLRTLVARGAIVGGIVAGAWLAGATVASAASSANADSDHRVEPSPPNITRVAPGPAPDAADSRKSDPAPTRKADPGPAKANPPAHTANSTPKSDKSNSAKEKSATPRSPQPKETGPAKQTGSAHPEALPQGPEASVVPAPSADDLAQKRLTRPAAAMGSPSTDDRGYQPPWQSRMPAQAPAPSTLSTCGPASTFGNGMRGGTQATLPANPNLSGAALAARRHTETILGTGTFVSGPPATPD